MKKYALIVIGAGISGLSAAIAWLTCKKGPVLVLEKEPVPGGCVASFRRDRYHFETVQLIPEMKELMGWLGVYCAFTPFTGTLARLHLVKDGKTRPYAIPATLRGFERQLVETWPQDSDAIHTFFSWCAAVHEELGRVTMEPNFFQMMKIAVTCPHVVRISNNTWKEFLNRFGFTQPELVETLDVFSAFASVSGDTCAALLTISAMETSLASSWRVEPSFAKLPEAMRRRVAELGGELRMNTRVSEILTREGTVQGVVTAAGEVIQSDTVVSTIDTKTLLEDLLDENALAKAGGPWAKARGKLAMSPSIIAINLGLDDDIDLASFGIDGAYNVLTTGRSAHEAAFRLWAQGNAEPPVDPKPGVPVGIPPEEFHVAFYSPSLASGDPAQNLVIHVTPVYGPPWIELRTGNHAAYLRAKDAVAARYIALLERYVIPGLSAHIRFRDISTPATFARYLGTSDGACYDMLPLVSQFGLRRLPLRGPFDGLYQTKFSHGIWPAMHAGMQVLDLITSGAVMKGAVRYRGGNNGR